MREIFGLLFLVLLGFTDLKAEGVSQVVLLGGSSVFTSYLPDDLKHDAVLQRALDQRYGAGRAEVHNWADNGEFIARFLITGKYEAFRAKAAGVDVFIVRFGTNDAKRTTPVEFGEHLRKLLDLLRQDFPDARFVLEDGLYLDYPSHYTRDRNKEQQPYWAQTRLVAHERNLPFSSLFDLSEKTTKAGLWDLRIRSQRNKVITFDDSKDAEHAGDIEWFTDIHPNPAGVKVAVDAEMVALETVFPESLPAGGRKIERPEKGADAYATLLNFEATRLKKQPTTNPDGLQKPLR